MIDDLKSACNLAGAGNSPGEYKIITQSFLYKFLNDKFIYELGQNVDEFKGKTNAEIEASIKEKNDAVKLQKANPTDFSLLSFTVNTITGTNREGVQPRPIHLCDFASAGNDWNTTQRYRVWLPKVIDVRKEDTANY